MWKIDFLKYGLMSGLWTNYSPVHVYPMSTLTQNQHYEYGRSLNTSIVPQWCILLVVEFPTLPLELKNYFSPSSQSNLIQTNLNVYICETHECLVCYNSSDCRDLAICSQSMI